MLLPLQLNNLMGGGAIIYSLNVSTLYITLSVFTVSARKYPRPGDARSSRRGLEYP